MDKKIIKFKYLYLKKIKKNTIEILRKERNVPQIRTQMLNQKIINTRDQLQWFKKIKKTKDCNYFNIYYEKTIIGSGHLKNISKKNKNCSWGFYIFKKYFGPFGVLSQYKIIEHAFKTYKLQKIYGQTLSTNNKILRVHKEFGFKTEGVLKNQIIIKKKNVDIILTSLFKNQWNKNKKKIFLKYFAKKK